MWPICDSLITCKCASCFAPMSEYKNRSNLIFSVSIYLCYSRNSSSTNNLCNQFNPSDMSYLTGNLLTIWQNHYTPYGHSWRLRLSLQRTRLCFWYRLAHFISPYAFLSVCLSLSLLSISLSDSSSLSVSVSVSLCLCLCLCLSFSVSHNAYLWWSL